MGKYLDLLDSGGKSHAIMEDRGANEVLRRLLTRANQLFATAGNDYRWRLKPCNDCGSHQFAWHSSLDAFVCATCRPRNVSTIVAYIIVPLLPGDDAIKVD
jgi:hypothetical protein